MEIQDLPFEPGLEATATEELDRIAFELWQRGSLPEVPAGAEAEVEEVAARASCL